MMIARYKQYLQTVFVLVYSDWLVIKENLFNKIIDTWIFVGVNVIITGYILPYFGLSPSFGVFMLCGTVSGIAIAETYSMVAGLVSDITGVQKITYDLLLPMPSWMVFLRIILTSTIQSMIYGLVAIPFGKLLLWNRFAFTDVNPIGFIVILTAGCLFSGTFAIVTSSMIKRLEGLSTVWRRFLFPLWFFGGFQFSWAAFYAVLPIAAYVNLINPILYYNEGMRDALIGSSTPGAYIPYYLCVPVLLLFSILFTIWGVLRFKKRLDFV